MAPISAVRVIYCRMMEEVKYEQEAGTTSTEEAQVFRQIEIIK